MKEVSFWKRYISPEMVGASLVLIISIWMLILKPIGLGNDFKTTQVINENGLYYLEDDIDINSTNFIIKYGIMQYANENNGEGWSTVSIPLKLTVEGAKLLLGGKVFDIRLLATVYITLSTIAAYIIIKGLSKYIKNNKYTYVISVVYPFIFCDISYLEYLNSVYPQGMQYTFFLLSIGILINMLEKKNLTLVNIILFSVTSLLFVFSSEDTYITGILVGIVLGVIGYITKYKIEKLTAFIIGGLILVGSGYATYEKSFNNDIVRFHTLTKGILLSAENPEEALSKLKIDKSYALLRGESYYNNIPSILPTDEKIENDIYKKLSAEKVWAYYLLNPRVLKNISAYVFENTYDIRLDYISNFTGEREKGEAIKSYSFSIYSHIKEGDLFRKPIFTGIFLLVFATLIFMEFKKSKDKNLLIGVWVYLLFLGILQIFKGIFGGGIVSIQHNMFLYNIIFDIMVLKMICSGVSALEG